MGKLRFLTLGNTIAGSVAIASLLGLLSPGRWEFSFLEHFRPQYCLILVIVICLNGLLRRSSARWLWATIWLVPLLVNIVLIAPILIGTSPRVAASTNLRLLHITLDHDQVDVNRSVQFANTQAADLVSLLEISPETLPQLQAGLTNYQLIKAEPRRNSHGSAWFVARQPHEPLQVMAAKVIHLPSNSDRPLLTTTINYGGKVLELLCFHVIRPRSAETVAYQQLEFDALAQWSQSMLKQGHEPIAIGDFNNTPWSLSFRQLLTHSGLHNSQNGFGLQPTWHSSLPTVLQIPIDHGLHSPNFSTRNRTIGTNIGSDHLPLLVDLQF